jgi:hypothetical protein
MVRTVYRSLSIPPTVFLILSCCLIAPLPVGAAQVDILGPAGSSAFGTEIAVLPNGNIVVTDPGAFSDEGAVYLYDPAGTLINFFTGSAAGDHIGGDGGGIYVLSNGNFVISSPSWNSGTGAVTWVNGSTGLSGTVSAANSLVGSAAGDNVGNATIIVLSNGNYIVRSRFWANGSATKAGAVTWADGSTGLSGAVSPANSLVGSTADDGVGGAAVVELSNGNCVVVTSAWTNGAAAHAGAVTWVNGCTGLYGPISMANSLVGTSPFDLVGGHGVAALTNGNYVVISPYWNNGPVGMVGAVTWVDGSTGLTGAVSAATSLVGTAASDSVGQDNVTALSNGNYVVNSTRWKNGSASNAGAATWGNGATGISGPVSPANSLVGSSSNDNVGGGTTALANGNYVVRSSSWHNGAIGGAGAVTWADGSVGLSGPVSTANSLYGTTTADYAGIGLVTALSNGNYVVVSWGWDNGGAVDAGAVTWGDGSTGLSGPITAANSLVGSVTNDKVGFGGVTALANGNYVISSFNWNDNTTAAAGAVTWADGNMGISGLISAANSLVGSAANDQIGRYGAIGLSNGNYAVRSPYWTNAGVMNAGAATWANGNTGLSGSVLAANSLVGTLANDQVSGTAYGDITALPNGNYVVVSPNWANGAVAGAGAVSLGRSDGSLVGPITSATSVLGTAANGGASMVFGYDVARDQLVVGRPASNIVTLFRGSDLIFANGFQ